MADLYKAPELRKPIWKSMADLMDDVEKATTIIGHGEPTSETAGKISQWYMDEDILSKA